MAGLSSILKNGQMLQAQAGALAIAAGDLMLMNSKTGQVFSAQSADHASANNVGATVVAPTTTGQSTSNYMNWRKGSIIAADGSIYVLGCVSAGTSGDGLQLSKCSPSGKIISQLVIENSGITSGAGIVQLTNGNFAVTWGNANFQYFCIVNNANAFVFGKTATGLIGSSGSNYYLPDILALAGGGFVIAGQLSNGGGVNYIVYTSAGGVTKALTAVTNGPTSPTSCYARLVQVANGNIVICIGCAAYAGRQMGFAIYDATGTAQVAYTVANGATTTLAQPPEISTIGNFFCVGWNDDTNANAYVYSNAGGNTAVLQGGQYTSPNATPTKMQIRVINDGAAFWFIYGATATDKATVVRLPTNGVGFVVTATAALFSGSATSSVGIVGSDAAIYSGVLILATTGTNNVTVHMIDPATFKVGQVEAFTWPTGHKICQIIPTFDFSVLIAGDYEFTVQKYIGAPIMGIAQQAVAAGNSGTVVPINPGPGSYPMNHIAGTPGKIFNHSGTASAGNKGVIFPDAIALAGMNAAPRNIN